ncbi:MAG: alpha/beta fold hydrolase [Frankiaceae bacterium]|nr:alpha/beta fold hydrolase [Frankiaceae bacterium]
MTESRVQAASGELAALVASPPTGVDRKRPVLAVPGYTGSKEDFIHLLPLLARAGHPAIAIDLRGQHESGGPEDPTAYTMAALGEDVASLLADGGPRHVLAHSFGGLICREAILGGAPAASLTLLCSGPGALGGKRGMLIELMRPLIEDGGVPAVFAATEELDAADPKKANLPPEIKDFLRRRFLAHPAAALLGMGTTLTTAPDRVAELRASGLPVLVAYGDQDDAWSAEEQADMARRLGVTPVVFAGHGHSPAVEDEAIVAEALERFWSAIDG